MIPAPSLCGATKIADRFYTNFGMAVISCEEAPKTRDHLYFRSFHLKDCAWLENELGEVDHLHRKEMISARTMLRRFSGSGDNISSEVKEAAEKTPNKEFEMRVVVMPADEYDMAAGKSKRRGRKLPFVICYIDVENGQVIREGGLRISSTSCPDGRCSRRRNTHFRRAP